MSASRDSYSVTRLINESSFKNCVFYYSTYLCLELRSVWSEVFKCCSFAKIKILFAVAADENLQRPNMSPYVTCVKFLITQNMFGLCLCTEGWEQSCLSHVTTLLWSMVESYIWKWGIWQPDSVIQVKQSEPQTVVVGAPGGGGQKKQAGANKQAEPWNNELRTSQCASAHLQQRPGAPRCPDSDVHYADGVMSSVSTYWQVISGIFAKGTSKWFASCCSHFTACLNLDCETGGLNHVTSWSLKKLQHVLTFCKVQSRPQGRAPPRWRAPPCSCKQQHFIIVSNNEMFFCWPHCFYVFWKRTECVS